MDNKNMMLNDLTGIINRQNHAAPPHVHYVDSRLQENIFSSMPSHSFGASTTSTIRKPRKAKTVNTVDSFETVPILQYTNSVLDDHAGAIACEMEKDSTLMEDNPQSEQLRIDTLREMPESLTLKRVVKKKLLRTVSQRSKKKSTGCFKTMQYRLSAWMKKLSLTAKDALYSLEPWNSSLKVIEGHFGSGVATYFRFYRWLFLLNIFFALTSLLFLAIPQGVFSMHDSNDSDSNTSTSNNSEKINTLTLFKKLQFFESENGSIEHTGLTKQGSSAEYFSFADIFVGEGSFTNSILYYGCYTNTSFSLIINMEYSMPLAYFFTTACCFAVVFLALSLSAARSYRRVFIETSGGVKNTYAHKIFCGWDFSIATNVAADLKSKSIYNEIRELLAEDYKESKHHNWKSWFRIISLRALVNCLAIAIFGGTGAAIWLLLTNKSLTWNYALPMIVMAIMIVVPWLLTMLLRIEDYESPRTALYVNLLRVFALQIVAIMAIVAYWFQQENSHLCWETSLGQELYRLVILDFFVMTLGGFIFEFLHKVVSKRFFIKSDLPEFDIARNTLNLIYNETLVFVGFFYSPLLPLVVALKMFISFYLKKVGILYNCQPSNTSWRAAQTQTVFLIFTFISLLAAVISYVYLVSYVHPSPNCGPFHDKISSLVMDTMFHLEEEHVVWKVIFFLTKPGVVGAFLIGMIFLIVYIRSKAAAHAEMIQLLKEMLVVEAEDKEFLLTNISKVTEMPNTRRFDDEGISKPSPRKSRQLQGNQSRPSSGNYSGAYKGMRKSQPQHLQGRGHKLRR